MAVLLIGPLSEHGSEYKYDRMGVWLKSAYTGLELLVIFYNVGRGGD